MDDLKGKDWFGIVKEVCRNIDVRECSVSHNYTLHNVETDDIIELPSQLVLDIQGVELARIVYTFEYYGLEETERLVNHYKLKNTPLYKVLNSDDKDNKN